MMAHAATQENQAATTSNSANMINGITNNATAAVEISASNQVQKPQQIFQFSLIN